MLKAIGVTAVIAGGLLSVSVGSAMAQYCPPGPNFNNCMNQARAQQRQAEENRERQERQAEMFRQQQQERQAEMLREQQRQAEAMREQQMRQQQMARPAFRPGAPERAPQLAQRPLPAGHVTMAHPYVYRGQALQPVRAPAYRFPRGVHYQHYAIGNRVPRALLIANYILNNWLEYGLGDPPAGDEWIRFGSDALDVDPNSNQVVDAAYGVFADMDEGVDQGQPDAGAPQYNWVGIAWNHTGFWATRPAPTRADAQQQALNACNEGGGNCYNSDYPVPGDRFMCFALYQDGNDEFVSQSPDKDQARATALTNCQNSNDPGPGCVLQVVACNNS